MASGLENGKNGFSRSPAVDDSFPQGTAVAPAADLSSRAPEMSQGCPHLGMAEDPATRFLFASPGGACYRAEPPELVSLAHQRAYCLTQDHVNCPVLQSAQAGPLPVELRGEAPDGRTPKPGLVWAVVGIMVGLVVITAVAFFSWQGNHERLTAVESEAALVIAVSATPTTFPTDVVAPAAVVEPSPTATPTQAHTPTSAPTATSRPTETPTAVPSPTLPATFTPAPTASPTIPPTAVPQVTVNVPTLNVRQGPGTDYPILGSITQGGQLEVVGQSFNGGWWQVCCVAGEPGWVFGEAVTVQGDVTNVPTVSVAPPEDSG